MSVLMGEDEEAAWFISEMVPRRTVNLTFSFQHTIISEGAAFCHAQTADRAIHTLWCLLRAWQLSGHS